MKISERMKEYRKENHLTQSEFASKLFVTKQAVSKWETENGYPDVSLYPKLAELFGISIDELMGVKKKEVEQPETKKKVNIGVILTIVIIGLIVLIGMIILIFKLPSSIHLHKLVKQTEKNIQMELPNIKRYEYFDTGTISTANSWYPNQSYYFLFKDDEKLDEFVNRLKNDENWTEHVDESVQTLLPLSIQPYCDTCQYFQFRNENNEIVHTFMEGQSNIFFYAYQEETNRLIVGKIACDVKK